MLTNSDIVKRRFNGSNFQEFIDDLTREIQQRNYRLTRINNIDNIHDRERLAGHPGISFLHYKIVEFCNLESCAELISSELLAGVFMPVRFSVYQVNVNTPISVAFLRPTAFANLFAGSTAALKTVARNIEQDMLAIVDELDF